MKVKSIDEIEPNHRISTNMVYYSACRTLRQLEANIRKTSTPENAKRQLILTSRIRHKLEQFVAKFKSKNEL